MNVRAALAQVTQNAQVIAFCLGIFCAYQLAWLQDHAPVKVWEKSRRIGASWIEAFYSVLQAALKKNAGGQNSYYLSYNKDMTRQFIKDCTWWAKVLGVICGEAVEIVSDWDKDITFFRISFASGNVIEALPSEARSIRSKQGRIVIDEAAFVDDLGELMKAAMAMLMWGGQVVILSTHNGVENPFNELINDIRAGKFGYSLHRTDFDQALEGGLHQAICRKKKTPWSKETQDAWRAELVKEYGTAAEEELFCIPSRTGGIWLTGALIESCMRDDIPVLEWSPEIARNAFDQWMTARSAELGVLVATGLHSVRDMLRSREFVDIPVDLAAALVEFWCRDHLAPQLAKLTPHDRHFCGGDFGRSGDLTVAWPLAETDILHTHTPFTLELRNAPFRVQEQFFFRIFRGLPLFSGAALDARGVGMQLAESCRQEFGPDYIAEVMLTEGWYRENMPPVKSALEDRSTTLPKKATVKDDFRLAKVIKGVPRIPDTRSGKKGEQRHGDSVIAYALARFAVATMGDAEPWECASAGEPESDGLLRGFV